MHLALRRNLRRLPKSFPVGTTYVVEGHMVEGHGDNAGSQLQVFSRCVVLPSGQRMNLGGNLGANFSSPAVPRGGASRTRNQGTGRGQPKQAGRRKKMMAGGGTSVRERR